MNGGKACPLNFSPVVSSVMIPESKSTVTSSPAFIAFAAGVSCVIAETFARIFYRNAINTALPILECDEAAKDIDKGDEVEIDFDTGVITNKTKGHTYQAQPFPEFIKEIIAAGGLLNSLKK